MMKKFQQKLERLKSQSRLRHLSLPHGIDLTSNDYLGMCNHPALRKAAQEALESGMDIGAGGSRLLRGHTPAHQDLEDFAAAHFGCGRALYFSTGFQANLAIFSALPSRHDVILFDSLVHASARDGIQASQARSVKVLHNDLNEYESALKRFAGEAAQIWIAVESVYSMDGDAAPLGELYALANKYGAILIVDEAHATGVLGEDGKGLAYDLFSSSSRASESERGDPEKSWIASSAMPPRNDGNQPDNLITLHTCGKAIGVAGGLVCGPDEIIDMLINTARPFIYSTAPMPLQAHLVQKSLEILASADGQARRDRLQELCVHAQSRLGGIGSHIVPVLLGGDEKALAVAGALQSAGYDVRAIRPPTVPENTARLRISLSTHLDEQTIDDFAAHLMPLLQEEAVA